MATSLRSPIIAGGAPFALPYVDVVSQMSSVGDTSSSEADSQSADTSPVDAAMMRKVQVKVLGPVAVLGRFIELGVPKDRPGTCHTLFFSRKPMSNVFSLADDTHKVSGYMSYNYLLSGQVVVGVVFSTENTRTRVAGHRLSVRSTAEPRNFAVNFNLEKMGLLLFLAEDSSSLAIPNDIASSLIVRTD